MKRDHSDKALSAFLSKHSGSTDVKISPPCREQDDPILHELVVGCLAWNAPRAGVASALDRMHEVLFDYNELRVMIPKEAAGLLGSRYPAAEERCLRLRSALNEVFDRENGLTLAHLHEENKRNVKAYLESIPGLPAYVASRVALLKCEVHTFPIDSVLHGMFDADGLIDDTCDESTLASRLERLVRAGDAAGCFEALEAAAMTTEPSPPKKSTSTRQQTTKKKASTKKPATKKTTTKKRGRKTA